VNIPLAPALLSADTSCRSGNEMLFATKEFSFDFTLLMLRIYGGTLMLFLLTRVEEFELSRGPSMKDIYRTKVLLGFSDSVPYYSDFSLLNARIELGIAPAPGIPDWLASAVVFSILWSG